MKCDFSGWATKNDLLCSDGRTIRKNSFAHQDGQVVPLVWQHQHNDPTAVIGQALLESRPEGVYAYCSLNDSEAGAAAKEAVRHGDIRSLSICAGKLKQIGQDVIHGTIQEVSLVLSGANPGAFIDSVVAHGDGEDEKLVLGYDENVMLWHSDDSKSKEPEKESDKKESSEQKDDKKESESEPTVKEVVDSMTEVQRNVMLGLIQMALEEDPNDSEEDTDDPDSSDDDKTNNNKGGQSNMKHNAFDEATRAQESVLTHADQGEILKMAKMKTIGSLQSAVKAYCEEHSDVLTHGYDDIEALFPDYKDIRPGAPELVTRDQGWVTVVMNKVHKSPLSRIRTKQVDARGDTLRGYGYKKTKQKKAIPNMKLIKRTTDPQTVYVKDALNRDDILDITDFDVIQYQYGIMRQLLNEEVATAIMVGDGREDGDEMKISEDHIRSIWNDDDLYTIHYDVDIEAAKAELQGSRTDMNFGENYIYAEATITAALYAREDYKGTGTPSFFCTPHLLNVMLLAKDLNGRRIYNSKADIAAALDVDAIYTVEQFEKLVRTDKEQKQHRLLGIITNLADYTVGSTKGGEITRFNQFDIDFNQEKYLIETRLSGALTRVYSAIALEEPVNP